MRILVAAVGRLKDGPERELVERYRSRFDALGRRHALGPLVITEFPESRAAQPQARSQEEATKLLAVAAGHVLALDEAGRQMSSQAFADMIRTLRDRGTSCITLLIGGPDGHGEAVREHVQRLSLGAMTLPHGLARVVLIEQLYRAATLIAGHPYHRV